jgi:hypothetical protein
MRGDPVDEATLDDREGPRPGVLAPPGGQGSTSLAVDSTLPLPS